MRTKRVEGKEYRQLVENYRENGKHHQRVLAHLGHHDNAAEALEEARAKLSDTETRGAYEAAEAEQEAQGWEEYIRQDCGRQLDHYHDGEIPTREEVARRKEVNDYYRAFGGDIHRYGNTHFYYGFSYYERRIDSYWSRRERADQKREEYNRRRRRLLDRIAKLEAVVTK